MSGTLQREPMAGRWLSLAFIVVINLIPLIGVLVWDWSLLALLFLYWQESFIVGAANVVKLAVSNGPLGNRVRIILFFAVHYGAFWLGHGLFLFVALGPAVAEAAGLPDGSAFTAMWPEGDSVRIAFWGLAASYALSTLVGLLRTSREDRLPPVVQMFAPYGRVFVMHIVILGGAFLAAEYASVLPVLLLFVGLKLAFDLGAEFMARNIKGRELAER